MIPPAAGQKKDRHEAPLFCHYLLPSMHIAASTASGTLKRSRSLFRMDGIIGVRLLVFIYTYISVRVIEKTWEDIYMERKALFREEMLRSLRTCNSVMLSMSS